MCARCWRRWRKRAPRIGWSCCRQAGTQSEAHLARHPFGRIPTIEHGTFELYETQAILRYLDRVLPSPPLTPAAPQAAGRMDQLLNISDFYLFQGVINVIAFHRIIAPRLLGKEPDEAAIEAGMPAAHRVVAELTRMLGDGAYLAGAELSLADIAVASHMAFLAETPEWTPLTLGRERLAAWLERVLARPSLQATTWEKVASFAEPSPLADAA